jgi:hypothetical protein
MWPHTPSSSTGSEIVSYIDGGGAFLYSEGSMKDLNTLIPAGSGWHLEFASSIDDTGQIVGFGSFNGHEHAYLLTPDRMGAPKRRAVR